jgi:hypothetical protein
MKIFNTKWLLTVALVSCHWLAIAQQSYFNVGNFNKELSGVLLMKSGETKKLAVICEHPDFLKRSGSLLKTSEGNLDKATLEAFSVDGRVWVYRQTPIGPYWVILKSQGAIEVYDYVNSDSEGKVSNIITIASAITKGKTLLQQGGLALGYKKKMGELVADNTDLAAKVGEKGYGFIQYLNVVDEYNIWYEKNNPGKTKYLPAAMGLSIPGNTSGEQSFSSVGEMREQGQANVLKLHEENQKKLNDLFEGRSSTVSTDLASSKDNTPVKKETFTAKLNRIKANGNKVGVVFYLKPIRVNPPLPGGGASPMLSTSEEVPIEGEYIETSLQPIGQEFTNELNAALGRTDIELIDLSKIPYRDVKVMGMTTRVDDWWATKYKVVFALTVDPRIIATHDSFGGEVKFTASFNLVSTLLVTEYIGNATSKEQDIVTQVLNMGAFLSPSISQKEDIKGVKELYDVLIEKLGISAYERTKKERADGVAKLAKRLGSK